MQLWVSTTSPLCRRDRGDQDADGFAVALAKEHGDHLVGIAFAPTALLPLYGAMSVSPT